MDVLTIEAQMVFSFPRTTKIQHTHMFDFNWRT